MQYDLSLLTLVCVRTKGFWTLSTDCLPVAKNSSTIGRTSLRTDWSYCRISMQKALTFNILLNFTTFTQRICWAGSGAEQIWALLARKESLLIFLRTNRSVQSQNISPESLLGGFYWQKVTHSSATLWVGNGVRNKNWVLRLVDGPLAAVEVNFSL